MADDLSLVMTHLEPETVRAVLDGATVGTSQRVERENPDIIKVTNSWNQKCGSLLGKSW